MLPIVEMCLIDSSDLSRTQLVQYVAGAVSHLEIGSATIKQHFLVCLAVDGLVDVGDS